jgi:hypothetical protein
MPIAIRSAIRLSASGPFNSRQAEAAPDLPPADQHHPQERGFQEEGG